MTRTNSFIARITRNHALPSLSLLATLTACGSPSTGMDSGMTSDATSDSAPGRDSSTADTTTRNDVARTDTGNAVDTGIPNDVAPPTPTASSWLGTNLSGDVQFVDITRVMAPFDTSPAQLDANGYPAAGASGTSNADLGFLLPTGDYKISYTGDGTVNVSGIGTLTGSWQTVGAEHRNVLHITGTPGSFGRFLTLSVNNASGAPVQNLRVLYPGYDYDTTEIFLAQYLRLLRPFRAVRAMDWERTNGSTLANWSDRPRAASFGASPNGEPYEYLVELANQTGKDLWVTIPEHATDDFVQQFATFLATGLDFNRIGAARQAQGISGPFHLMFEISNETWNGGFSAYNTLLAAAQANPSRYDGVYDGTYGPSWMAGITDLMRVGQYEADALARDGDVFRAAFTAVGHADAVAPVLSGWALGAVYSDVGLRFIQRNYTGPLSHYVSYVAIAPYFGPDDAQTGSLDALFASAEMNIQSMDMVFRDFRQLVDSNGIAIAAYEGGQGIAGPNNLMVKHLAQHDRRMYQAYQDYFTLWNARFGDALFMHFTLAGTAGLPENIYQYGFWGSIRSVTEDPDTCGRNLPTLTGSESVDSVVGACPKYEALQEHVPR